MILHAQQDADLLIFRTVLQSAEMDNAILMGDIFLSYSFIFEILRHKKYFFPKRQIFLQVEQSMKY